MKQLFLLLLAGTLLASCSKSGDDDDDNNPPPGKTTVKFTNTLSYDWSNTLLGTIKASGAVILIKNIGTIKAGASTADIEITDNTIGKVFLYYDDPNTGKTVYTDYGFLIAQNTNNNWILNTNLHLATIEKTSPLYPK